MDIKVLALDLDGTLTNSSKEVTERTKKAIFEAIDRGVVIVLASGRPDKGIEPVARALELEQRGGYILAYNGGKIIDCRTGEVISAKLLSKEYYADIIDAAHRYNVVPVSYDEIGVLSESDTDQYVIKESVINKIPIHKVDDMVSVMTEPVTKMMLIGDHEKLIPAHEYFHERYEGCFEAFFSEGYFLEITPRGIEKSSALGVLLEHLGTTKEHLMVCGDGLNDVTMIEYAGLGVAMENAAEETKKHADAITLSNDEDGVAVAIEKYILNS